MRWLAMQLVDSAFPTGAFAHSAGLEAALHAGELRGVAAWCEDLLAQAAYGAVPLVAAGHAAGAAAAADPTPSAALARWAALDELASAVLWSHVAARASRAQGRALLDVAARAFGGPLLIEARARAARGAIAGHLAPAFGLVAGALGVTAGDALAGFLHATLRGALSAAVRLGAIGPAEAQRVHGDLHGALERALAVGAHTSLDELAQPAPILELVQATHDRLYSRLFQS
jgi:urease accessory protein